MTMTRITTEGVSHVSQALDRYRFLLPSPQPHGPGTVILTHFADKEVQGGSMTCAGLVGTHNRRRNLYPGHLALESKASTTEVWGTQRLVLGTWTAEILPPGSSHRGQTDWTPALRHQGITWDSAPLPDCVEASMWPDGCDRSASLSPLGSQTGLCSIRAVPQLRGEEAEPAVGFVRTHHGSLFF